MSQEFDGRNLSQRCADAVTEFCGSWTFIIVFSGVCIAWMAGGGAFDPFPYILLNLFLTVISTFQSPLIMMSQNRQTDRDRLMVEDLHAKFDALDEKLDRIMLANSTMRSIEPPASLGDNQS
jgi:uncharacterized membrane protein